MPNNSYFSEASRDKIRSAVLGEFDRHQQPFIPGESHISVTEKVLDEQDFLSMVDAVLDGWLTSGRFHDEFEKLLAARVGMRSATFVNSGSSANLIALSALTSPKLGRRALKPGDEVITVAAGFPTTVNPILQNGLTPVFVDVNLGTYDAVLEQVEEAIGPKTRAVMMAHTLGNPFQVQEIADLCKEHGLWLIEDNCDSLGSTYQGRPTGSFGDLSTLSFYPAHHITTGEGGAVLTKSPLVRRQVESFRDWGRDCYCPTGEDNTCKKRFGWSLGGLPDGYDHKYTYSHIGYNLKATDLQAALGVSQIKKLDVFVAARRRNFTRIMTQLEHLEDLLILPKTHEGSDPSWFGFPITLRDKVSKSRSEVVADLDSKNIGTRLLFGGNLLKQPAYQHIKLRKISDLRNTDTVMRNTFWIGTHPGLSDEKIDFMTAAIVDSVTSK
jgi:CDP-6-deoxy-D-xylo-4-hexulose-3-dehydrase